MEYKLNWTNSAIQDLHDFYSITKKVNQQEYVENLVKNVNHLKTNTELGKPKFYINHILVRQFIHEEHKILYYVTENTVHIISVIHYKQDTNSKLKFIKKYLKDNKSFIS